MTVQELIIEQLRSTAEVTIDPQGDGTPYVVDIDGLVDVDAIVGIALEHAARVIDSTLQLGTMRAPGKVPTPHEIARELRAQGQELRS